MKDDTIDQPMEVAMLHIEMPETIGVVKGIGMTGAVTEVAIEEPGMGPLTKARIGVKTETGMETADPMEGEASTVM
jgi:hypothetical protein